MNNFNPKTVLVALLTLLASAVFTKANAQTQKRNFLGLNYEIPADWAVASLPDADKFYGLKKGTLGELQIFKIEGDVKQEMQKLLQKRTILTEAQINALPKEKINNKAAKIVGYDIVSPSEVTQETFYYRLYTCNYKKANYILLFTEIVKFGEQRLSMEDEKMIINSIK